MGKEGRKKKKDCDPAQFPRARCFNRARNGESWEFFFSNNGGRGGGIAASVELLMRWQESSVFLLQLNSIASFSPVDGRNYLSVVVSISLSGFHDNEYGKGEKRNRIVRKLFSSSSICLATALPCG